MKKQIDGTVTVLAVVLALVLVVCLASWVLLVIMYRKGTIIVKSEDAKTEGALARHAL